MLLFDPPNRWTLWTLAKQHKPRAFSCFVIGVAVLAWYGLTWLRDGEQPGGSSLPGLVTGIPAGILMLFLFSYALRKVKPFSGLFSRFTTNFWLRQHIWLGLLTIPLVVVHASRISHWGTLTMLLLAAYAGVILSGILGLFFQQRFPTRLLEDIPDETIRSQIPELTEQLRHEAELLVLATCGPPPGSREVPLTLRNHIDVVRSARGGRGSGLLAVLPSEPIPESEPLRRYYNDTVDPYLRPTASGRPALFLRARIEKDFRDLRGRLPPEALPVIEALHDLCERRRQFDEQSRLHGWLHTWVAFHLTLSAALVVLLISHAVTAIWYW